MSFVARAQNSSINPDKVKALSAPDMPQSDVPLKSGNAELVPSAVFTNNTVMAIPDDGYNGAISSMACSTINTTSSVAPNTLVASASVSVNPDHTWIGDLTIKLRAPDGKVLTILNRPGSTAPDNGTDDPIGDNSNWAAGTSITFADGAGPEAETLGNGLTTDQRVCLDNGICKYDPSPDTATTSPASFAAAFNGQTVSGNWTLCVGDSALGDVGTLNSWTLKFISPTAVAPAGMASGIGCS